MTAWHPFCLLPLLTAEVSGDYAGLFRLVMGKKILLVEAT